ncbi:MAG: DNA polymerase III subunit chi [Paracoccaceae bacterium]
MGAVYFYHLTRRPLEDTLSMLLAKAMQAGWRVAVRGSKVERLTWLDEKLWLGPEEGFLPHGMAGGAHDTLQPVLLTQGPAGNDPQCVMAIDGAEVSADELTGLERACVLFDGNDAQALDVARGQWKKLKESGASSQYWSEESGRWEMKAQTGD